MLDLSKLSKDLKNLLTHSLTIPYWYVTVYIFHHDLFISTDNYLVLALCFCLSLSSSFFTSIFVIDENVDYALNTRHTRIVVVLQIMWFSILLFFSYISKIEFNNTFKFYGFVIAYILGLYILSLGYTANAKKNVNQQIEQ